ncbi:MAG: hypothetical protein ACKOYN_02030 [Planctomycetota bacterium]
MLSTSMWSRFAATAMVASTLSGVAAAQQINFEPTAGETTLGDDSVISTDRDFAVANTSVRFGWDTNGDLLADAAMRLEDYNDGLVETAGVGGYSEFGFADANGLGWDRDLDVQGDNWFMRVAREDGYRINTGSMLMSFASGVASVSGRLLDLDWNERFRVTAYSASGSQIAMFETIQGPGDESASSYNSKMYNWSISANGAAISFVRISFIGDASVGGGWGFDNLDATAIPAPGAIALLGLAGLAGRRRR